jgi:hypothetical protein
VVLAVVPKKKLYWRGRLLFSKLFTEEHCFEIEELEPNLVRFIQYERHHSALLPLVSQRIEFDAKRGFKEMNRALKIRAEKID